MAGEPVRKIAPEWYDRENPDAPPVEATGRTRQSITARAIAIGIPLVAINAYWISVVEVRWYTLDGTSLPLFITPIFFLFLLCLLNLMVKAWRKRPWLEQGELLVVY